jgi:hypothetical protein
MQTGKNHKIEEILSSLDAVKKAEAPDFFYTRLKARMLARQSGGLARQSGDDKSMTPASPRPWMLRPAFAFAMLVVILLVNALIIINTNNSSPDALSNSPDLESIQSIAAEYSVADAGSLYDLNPDR